MKIDKRLDKLNRKSTSAFSFFRKAINDLKEVNKDYVNLQLEIDSEQERLSSKSYELGVSLLDNEKVIKKFEDLID